MYHAIVGLILHILQESEYDFEQMISEREENIACFGKWHFYWAVYFHPGSLAVDPLYSKELDEVVDFEAAEDELECNHIKTNPSLKRNEKSFRLGMQAWNKT